MINQLLAPDISLREKYIAVSNEQEQDQVKIIPSQKILELKIKMAIAHDT